MTITPQLSIIIPVHNEQRRLPAAIDKIHRWHKTQPERPVECVLVENGSVDFTLDQCMYYSNHFTGDFFRVRALVSEPGKGAAVKHGMLNARGIWRYMCDVDLSTPIETVETFMAQRGDVVIGSRFGDAVQMSARRRMTGRVFHQLVAGLVPGIHDTQCGFKMFHWIAADAIFRHVTLAGWAFDVELLYIARMMSYEITELPVPWVADADSRVSLLRDSLAMARDVGRIKRIHSHLAIQEKAPA